MAAAGIGALTANELRKSIGAASDLSETVNKVGVVFEGSAESVMAVINSQHGRVMYTYNKYLRQTPTLRGKVSLDVTIAADGRVSNVQVVESTIQNADFIRDLLTIIRQLRFPAISEGTVTVNVPFVFNRVE